MSEIINLFQTSVSDTSPKIKILAPIVVNGVGGYSSWGFNLKNGNGETVYQDGNTFNDNISKLIGSSVVLGSDNTIVSAETTLEDVIIIGHNLSVHDEKIIIGQWNYASSGTDFVLAAGTNSSDRFNAFTVATVDEHKVITIGNNSTVLSLPNGSGGFVTSKQLYDDIATINGKIPVGASSSNKLVDTTTANNNYVERDKTVDYDAAYVQFYNNGSYYDSVRQIADGVVNSSIVVRTSDGRINAADAVTNKNVVTYGQMTNALALKQDKLTFDNAPTAGSNNPVTSDGIKTAIANAISSVYKPMGSSSVSSLNNLTKTATLDGYVYDVSDAGTLTNYDGSDISVIAGDNVVFIWDGGSWYWDKLSGIIDLSGYVQTSRTIAGIALSADISVADLSAALFTITEVTV